MSQNVAFSQSSDFDANDSIPRLWIDLSLREIRLLQTHNSVLTRMRQYMAENQAVGEVRSELMASFPVMEERSREALRDARKMFRLAQKYERSVSGGTSGDSVTRGMAALFASGRGNDATPGAASTQQSSFQQSLPNQPTPQQPAPQRPAAPSSANQQPAPARFTPTHEPAARPSQSGGAATGSTPRMAAVAGNHFGWQSSQSVKRRADDDVASDSSGTSQKRRRVGGLPSGIGEKRASAEPLETINEDGHSNKRIRMSAPLSKSTTPAPLTSSPSAPPLKPRPLARMKRIPDEGIKELAESNYGSNKRQRMSSPSGEPDQAHNNWRNVEHAGWDSSGSDEAQQGPDASKTSYMSGRRTALDASDDGRSSQGAGPSMKRARRASTMPHVFAAAQGEEEEEL